MKRPIVLLALLATSFCVSAQAQEAVPKSASEARKERILSYLEASSNSPAPAAGSAQQRVVDMYASYMDTARIDSLGLKPLQEDLQKIVQAKSKQDIAALYGQGNFIYVPFHTEIRPHPTAPGRYVAAISQSGLDLQTRAPYVDMDAKAAEVREKFVVLVSQLLALVDERDNHARAERVLKLETAIAKVSRTDEQKGDEANAKDTWTLTELHRHAPGFDWSAYLKSNGIPEPTALLVAQRDVVREVARVTDETELQVLKDHLTFSLICTWGWAGVLPQSVYDVQFAFYGRLRRGTAQPPDRRSRAFRFLARTLPKDIDVLEALLLAGPASVPAPTSTPTNGPLVRRDDAYGNAKRAQNWNWQREVAPTL